MSPIQFGDFLIRRAEPRDESGAYHVCLATGDAGQSAEHLFEDPKALGHIYVGPYFKFEPELAFVSEDARGICGYVLGALDSKRFLEAYTHEWLPPLRARYPVPVGDATRWNLTQRTYHEYHHPDLFRPEPFDLYPSHLHIDLLPRAQNRGLGGAMMEVVLGELVARNSAGVYLGMADSNIRAERFYRKHGFHDLSRVPGTLYLGKRLNQGRCRV